MLSDFIFAPSMNSLLFTGLILLVVVIIFLMNFNSFRRLNYYKQLTLLCLMISAFGIHGLLHLGLETNYGFNPYNWF